MCATFIVGVVFFSVALALLKARTSQFAFGVGSGRHHDQRLAREPDG